MCFILVGICQTVLLIFIVVSSGLPQVSLVCLSIEMIQSDSQTLKMIPQDESFLCSNKQGTPEEGQRIQRLKRCVSTYHNKDEDNGPKNHN